MVCMFSSRMYVFIPLTLTYLTCLDRTHISVLIGSTFLDLCLSIALFSVIIGISRFTFAIFISVSRMSYVVFAPLFLLYCFPFYLVNDFYCNILTFLISIFFWVVNGCSRAYNIPFNLSESISDLYYIISVKYRSISPI